MSNSHCIYSHDSAVKYGYFIYKDSNGNRISVTNVADANTLTAEQALADYNWRDKRLVFSGEVEFVESRPASAYTVRKGFKA